MPDMEREIKAFLNRFNLNDSFTLSKYKRPLPLLHLLLDYRQTDREREREDDLYVLGD
jgi:hypothetical protein